MTKRIKQHQLEDTSRYKYGLTLPAHWVFRDKDKDYGIDGEVEIFDKDNIATGLVYWVQLKATESKKEPTIKSIDIKLDTLKYYKRLDIPVLIVRYSSHKDIFYTKWAHEIDPFYAKENAKTMRVKFEDSDLWNENTSKKIETYLYKLKALYVGALSLPIDIEITFGTDNLCGVGTGVLLSKIRSELKTYKELLRLKTDKEKAIVNIFIDKKVLKIGILSVAGSTFHSVGLMDKASLPEELIKDILLGVAGAAIQLGYNDLAGKIVFSQDISQHLIAKPEIMNHLVSGLLVSNYFDETLDLVNEISDKDDSNLLEMIASAGVLFSGKRESKYNSIENFLIKNTERSKARNNRLYGLSMYNLGNFYRGSEDLKKACKCYLIARRYENKYYNQDYFFYELAGILFDLGKYKFSRNFYKRAIDLGSSEELRPQYADALMFSGEYQASLDLFDEYLTDTNSDVAGWHLKEMSLQMLIDRFGMKEQTRQASLAITCADIPNDESNIEEGLQKALEYDLLCGLAWFNIGQLKFNQGEIEEASFCFMICSLVQPWDIEAWVNATVLSFNSEVPMGVLVFIIQAAYFVNRDEYLDELYKKLGEQCKAEKYNDLTSIIEEIITSRNEVEHPPKLRLLDDDGKFKDISEFKKT